MKDADVIVVGGGVSGLLSALALSKEGKTVLLLEKSEVLGGNARSYRVGDFQVDTGPHAITYIQDGPLRHFINSYFDLIPSFAPYGAYYVRDRKRLLPFPWTLQEWMTFSILPSKDRIELVQLIISAIASSPLGKTDLNKTVSDFIGERGFSEKTWRFIDALCYFMSGKSMREAPAWRMLKGARYLEEKDDRSIVRVENFLKLKKLVSYDGAYHQAYPRAGLQAITDAIIYSMPKKNAVLRAGEEVTGLTFSGDSVSGVETNDGSYKSGVVVYSGMVRDLPSLAPGKLPADYERNLDKIQVTTSITLWLGLKKVHPQLKYLGSEIWFEDGKPYWAMPTSNYNPSFAPKGGQVVGFTSFAEGSIPQEKKKLSQTVHSALPGIKELTVLEHYQVTNPEKAAVTSGVVFPGAKTPLPGLYVAGTDTDMRSMGLTRAAFSVENLLSVLRGERFI